ncbi:hsp70-binding protein 1 isoform X2 [Ostrinia furnacalis]|uniref:hsp70-binding protein 1 isoform X1 n=1 Tax=Ostrinia furnacalis TaxID=93504 RepID=UPI00103A4DAE|nr:hsp70-binding protein 1 isoform X1 [Ostrinia furnacalis]XP_028170128.1 hsp70-binding protein 1 isoform X2 [Ostrinia furnacalis]
MSSNQQNNPPIAGAITYPSRSEQDVQPVPIQPRQPRNLQGLLRFAMEATKAEDAPGNSDLGPMDEERRKFLEEALKSLTVNLAEVLQNAIRVLTNQERIRSIKQNDTVPEDVVSSFNNLLMFIDDIDVANDFYKMGGFAIFPVCLGCENDEVRVNACWVLGELCQNNPYCQARALECGLLDVLLSLAQTEQGTALAKCLYAISCLCREFEPACRALVAAGGCATLTQQLSASDLQARTKAAFFIRHLCQHRLDAREQFIAQNLVQTVTEQIRSGRDEATEHLLSVLDVLTSDLDRRVLAQCSDPSLGLRKVLEDTLLHEEEKKSCQELLTRVFDSKPVPLMKEEEPER